MTETSFYPLPPLNNATVEGVMAEDVMPVGPGDTADTTKYTRKQDHSDAIHIDIASHIHPATAGEYVDTTTGPKSIAQTGDAVMSDTAALIAALGNKSNDGTLAALMASQGGGLGGNGGLLGTLVALSLLGNRNGLFGNNGFGNGVVCADGGANPAVTAVNQASVQEGISDIKAAIPLTACQTQGAVATAAADINSQALQQAISQQKNISDQSLAMQMGFAGINNNVTTTGNQVLGAVSQLQLTIHNEGELTRNLINQINTESLNRQLSDANTKITELMADRRADEGRRATEINVSQISTQVATQQASQQAVQQQQIVTALNGIAALLGENTQLTRQAASIVNLGGTVMAQQSPSSANTVVR